MTARSPVAAEQWCGESRDHWLREWRIPGLRIFAEAASTNDVARALARGGAAAGTTVIADHQWAGRGREGRAWHDEPRLALLLSLVLRPKTGAHEPGPTPLRVGMAVCAALERCADLPAKMKWPNDILAPDGAKLGGILCEATRGPEGAFVIAGIGINVLQPAGTPSGIGDATSIQEAAGAAPSRADLAGAIIDALRPFELSGSDLTGTEMLEFRRRDALLGNDITVDGRAAGVADGILPDGALIVKMAGAVQTVRAGTIRISASRPAGRDDDPVHPPRVDAP